VIIRDEFESEIGQPAPHTGPCHNEQPMFEFQSAQVCPVQKTVGLYLFVKLKIGKCLNFSGEVLLEVRRLVL
jgi:hypothetical protein